MKLHLIVGIMLLAATSLSIFKKADNIYYNGDIITMEGETPKYVSVIAERQGRIIYSGSIFGIALHVGQNTNFYNLKGQTLIPGFIDCHSHITQVGLVQQYANLFCAPDGHVNSFQELRNTLNQWINRQSRFIDQVGWIIGFGYDDSNLLEKVHPDKKLLDQISQDFPIIIVHQSGHLGVLNTKALQVLNLTDQTPDPIHGRYRRYPNSQQMTGVIEEDALDDSLDFAITRISDEMRKSGLVKGQQVYLSQGYTTAQDGYTSQAGLKIMRELSQQGKLAIDIMSYPSYQNIDLLDKEQYKCYVGKINTNRLRIAGIKLYLDGSIQGKTGWLSHPYQKPISSDDLGYLGYPKEQFEVLTQKIKVVLGRKLQLITHVNGDAAIDQYLQALQVIKGKNNYSQVSQLSKQYSNIDQIRVISIHSQMSRPDQLEKMIELKVIPSFFGQHTYYWGDWHYTETMGPERAVRISPAQTAINKKMIFTQHTDAPVVLPNPRQIIWCIVNRLTRSGRILGQSQRISAYHALLSITRYASYQTFEQNDKGTLTVGKKADMVILDQNPLKIDPLKLNRLKIIATIKDGKIFYQNNSL